MITRHFLIAVVCTATTFQTLAAEGITGPIVTNTLPADHASIQSLNTIEVFFSEEVAGVDAADLLINGVGATNVSSFGADQYVFSFAEPPGGNVTVTWAADHGIHDLSAAANAFTPGSWSYFFDPAAPNAGILINEFVADNKDSLNDEDGDSSDWIELFNQTDLPVDLTGWFLSNDTNNLARWKLPGVTIESKSYLIIFASEKNRTSAGSKLHTNFKLSNDGGFLGLMDSQTNRISTFNYPAQQEDVSYGRDRSNPSLLAFFPTPTPNAANSVGGAGFTSKVHFSRRAGTFTAPFQLVLTAGSSNAVIRYSLTNPKNIPTEASNLYTGPILITNTVHVRARAFEAGFLPSEPESKSYISLTGSVVNATSDLPIVILHNYGGGAVPATGQQFVMMQIFEPKNGVTSMTNPPDLSERAIFRRRGSSTQDYPKWSFALEAWDEFNLDKKVPVLGMPEESDWVFYAPNNFEPVLIHNPFMYQLSRDIGTYATRTRFAEVYLNFRGGPVGQTNYFGIYAIEEKIKQGPNRVDVDKLEPEHLKPPQVTGGYMLKVDRPDPGDSSFSAAGIGEWNWVEPKGPVVRTAARDPQEQYLLGFLRSLGTNLNSAIFKDPVEGYAKYIDVGPSIDHHILNVLAFNVDALRLSTYLYKPRNGKLTWGPVWDFDRALGSTDGRDANPRSWGDSGGTSFFQWPIWSKMFTDPDFWQKWIDRWEQLRLDQFSTNHFNQLIDELTGQVRNAQVREFAKWRTSAPVRGSYQSEIDRMKNYLRDRAAFIDAQLVRPPVLIVPGGTISAGKVVTLMGTNTIYYTLDGTDPRLPAGGISPKALTYSNRITLPANARLMARSHKPGHNLGPTATARSPWSGLVAATYVVQTPPLAITEIMYNPADPSAGSTNSSGDFEFVEVKNSGTTALNLAGFTFTNGIEFTFTNGVLQPGERTVVVKSRAAFQSRYGNTIPIAGEFNGALDNNGERVVLLGPLLEPIADFIYKNDWYKITDGPGFSLVPRDENTPLSSYGLAATWRQSARFNGSPGAADTAAPNIPGVVVNEILSATTSPQLDMIELYNPGSEPAQIGGWYLTDDFSNPKKIKIAAGATIPARGYVTFDETQFNAGPQGFAFNSDGDQVYLFSADASGELTGYFHGFQFGAAANGVSFGRFIATDQSEHFVAQKSRTFGAANAGPVIGPVVISEIMFEPMPIGAYDNTADEFIEIQNVSGQTVQLFDAAHRTNTWRLRGGTDFEFRQDLTLPPNGYAVIVNFDPDAEPWNRDAFVARFGVPVGVPILGPYEGKLSNEGERISLLSPGLPETSGAITTVPHILVDEANYSPLNPWPPGASGTGKSIQRDSSKFGDDAFSWVSADPTPGRALITGDNDSDRDGLPSDWETANGLNPNDVTGVNGATGDPDGDGLTNMEEYLAGTNPQSAASTVQLSASFVGGQRILSFQAAAGKSYTIEYQTVLGTDFWQKLADFPASAVAGQKTAQDTSPDRVRFYRVVTH